MSNIIGFGSTPCFGCSGFGDAVSDALPATKGDLAAAESDLHKTLMTYSAVALGIALLADYFLSRKKGFMANKRGSYRRHRRHRRSR